MNVLERIVEAGTRLDRRILESRVGKLARSLIRRIPPKIRVPLIRFGPLIAIVTVIALFFAALSNTDSGRKRVQTQEKRPGQPGQLTPGGEDEAGAQAATEGEKDAGAGTRGKPTGGGGTSGGAAPGSGSTVAYKGETGVDAKFVRIGIIYPQSGTFAPFFEQYPKVYQAAFNDVNARGGIHGRSLVLETGDEGESASRAQAAARQLAPQVFAFTSGIQEAAVVDFAEEAGVPTMALLGNIVPGALKGKNKYAFVAGTSPEYFEPRNGPSLIHARFPNLVDRTAFVYTSDGYAGSGPAFLKTAPKHGVDVIHVEKLSLNQTTCLNAVTNVQNANPKIVYVHASSLEAACFFRDARAAGFQPQWAGRLAKLTNQLSGNSNEGMVGVTYLRGMKSQEGQRAAATYKKYYPNEDLIDIEPNLLAWAVAQIWIEWINKIGAQPTRGAFPSVIEAGGPYPSGLLGPQAFSPSLHVGSEHTIAGHVKDGEVVITDDVWRTSYDGITHPPFYPFR